jgi:hypothetical protein
MSACFRSPSDGRAILAAAVGGVQFP